MIAGVHCEKLCNQNLSFTDEYKYIIQAFPFKTIDTVVQLSLLVFISI